MHRSRRSTGAGKASPTSTPTLPVSESASSALSVGMPMSIMALRKRWLTLRLARRRSLAVRCICELAKPRLPLRTDTKRTAP